MVAQTELHEIEGTDSEQVYREVLHQGRNLVMATRGYAELLEKHPDAVQRAAEWSTKIVDHLDRLGRLLNVLDTAFPEGEQPTQPFRLQRLLRMAELRARRSGYEGPLTWEFHGDVTLRGPAQEFVRAFSNIIENAFEASSDQQPVRIELRTDGPWWSVEVADMGDGVPLDVHARLMQPFATHKPGRLGLGLFLSRKTLERHGCVLRVESISTGGTRAVITNRKDA